MTANEKKTDLRILKTRNAIINAFITLRAKKALDKITVKELADLAMINKATFYLHYKDIYDLSDTLENDALEQVIKDMPDPELLIFNPEQGTKDLFQAFATQGQLFTILFSGDRFDIFVRKIDCMIKEYIYKKYPEKRADLQTNILLSIITYGGFHAYENYKKENGEEAVLVIAKASSELAKLMY